MTARGRLATVVALSATTWPGCARDHARLPMCGIAQLAGPTLIQQQLANLSYVLTEAPRGLPTSLPARVVYMGEGPKPEQGEVLTAYNGNRLVMGYQGAAFPAPPGGYGLLVVDDSTRRAQGVLVYESQVPRNYPELGTVTGAERSIPLFGVRVNWPGVNDPRCPLLGSAKPAVAQ
jgi:hypothetical protein